MVGYFENSGAATALDMLREINRELCADKNHALGVIVPKVIMISKDPLGIASGSRKISQAKSSLREANQHKPWTFLEDARAPLHTLFSTREARGSYAQRAISTEQDDLCETIAHSPPQDPRVQMGVCFFSLAPATLPLPLGWMLSNGAAKAMQDEMNDEGQSQSQNGPREKTWNQIGVTRVIECLHPTGAVAQMDSTLKP